MFKLLLILNKMTDWKEAAKQITVGAVQKQRDKEGGSDRKEGRKK